METPGGRILRQRPVRPMSVVMIGVLTKDQPQVPFVGDQHLVQALPAGAAWLRRLDLAPPGLGAVDGILMSA
jgi:hypothetical protein